MDFSDQNLFTDTLVNNSHRRYQISVPQNRIISELQQINFIIIQLLEVKVLFIMPYVMQSLPGGHHIWKPHPTKMLGYFPMNLL